MTLEQKVKKNARRKMSELACRKKMKDIYDKCFESGILILPEKDLKRFWSKVKKTNGCWLWIGALDKMGYGFQGGFYNLKAHRISYELAKGILKNGEFVLHKCDNPKCVNPNHLFAGTHKDNMNDMMIKGKANSKKTGATSRFYGVNFFNPDRNYWRARVTFAHTRLSLGLYKNEIDAAKAYDNHVITRNLPIPLNFPVTFI